MANAPAKSVNTRSAWLRANAPQFVPNETPGVMSGYVDRSPRISNLRHSNAIQPKDVAEFAFDIAAPLGLYSGEAEASKFRKSAAEKSSGLSGKIIRAIRGEQLPVAPAVDRTQKMIDTNRLLRGEGKTPPDTSSMFSPVPAPLSEADRLANLDAFMKGSRGNPKAFEYGLAPKSPYMDEIAQHYAKTSGKPVHADFRSGDEPEYYEVLKDKTKKIETEMENPDYVPPMLREWRPEGGWPQQSLPGMEKDPHSVMRINPEYDDALHGGIPEYKTGKEDYEYQEKVKVANPSYEDSIGYEIRGPRGYIDYDPDSGGIGASSARGDGALLYQVANSHAAMNDIPLRSTSGLTEDNRYRLLSNALSTYARHGVNPRDVTGTYSGAAPRATGRASGPEMWRAEAGETASRLQGYEGDPERLKFVNDDLMDTKTGTPVTLDTLKANIKDYSPGLEMTKVGPKALVRSALLRHLNTLNPADAEEMGRRWGKLGPVFSGVGAFKLGDQPTTEER